jgi:hypothetical protein
MGSKQAPQCSPLSLASRRNDARRAMQATIDCDPYCHSVGRVSDGPQFLFDQINGAPEAEP